MWNRHAIVLLALVGSIAVASAQEFRIDDVPSARDTNGQDLKPQAIAFPDQLAGDAADGGLELMRFADWEQKHPAEKKFLALFPSYAEPTVTKSGEAGAKPVVEKLYVYVAQARFVLDQA